MLTAPSERHHLAGSSSLKIYIVVYVPIQFKSCHGCHNYYLSHLLALAGRIIVWLYVFSNIMFVEYVYLSLDIRHN